MKIKIYLASRYSRHIELQEVAKLLREAGYEVTSRWINGDHQISDEGLSSEAKEAERTRFAVEDWADLLEAHVVINYTETPRSSNSRGGRHVEFGAALALNLLCIVIGPRENVFHCLPQVVKCDNIESAIAFMNERYNYLSHIKDDGQGQLEFENGSTIAIPSERTPISGSGSLPYEPNSATTGPVDSASEPG